MVELASIMTMVFTDDNIMDHWFTFLIIEFTCGPYWLRMHLAQPQVMNWIREDFLMSVYMHVAQKNISNDKYW